MVDLVKYPAHAAGWDNIAAITRDLGSRIRVSLLDDALKDEETPVLQRLGWLLDRLGFPRPAKTVLRNLAGRAPKWVFLEPNGPDGGEEDPRFKLRLNYVPEVDS